MAPTPPAQGRTIVCVALLALALLWAQSWGQWHGVWHAKSAPQEVLAESQTRGLGGHASAPEHAVFDHDAGDAQCRLLDQLSHADSLPCMPLLALPVELSAALVAQSVGSAVARWAALFQARGPPTFR